MSQADQAGAGPGAVQISGPATLYEASEVHETLASALGEGGDVVLDLETSGPWDLSGLQLLLAAAASGRRLGVSVRLRQVPRGCAEIAERCGLGDWMREHAESFL